MRSRVRSKRGEQNPLTAISGSSNTSSLQQLLAQCRIAFGEWPFGAIAAEAAHVHLQLGVQIVGVMENQTFRYQRQTRRTPLRQRQMAQDNVFEHLHQLRVDVT